ncbi:MAG: hypothetical protein ABI459_06220 [Deltaproteobacteria bacterium]
MTENLGLILLMLVAFVAIGSAWWILTMLYPLARDGVKYRNWAIVGLQVNLLLIIFAFMVRPSGLFWGVLAPWYPPLAMVTVGREGFLNVAHVLSVPLIAGVVAACAVFLAAYFYRPLRLFALGLAGAVGLAVAALQAPGFAATKITDRARALNASCLAQVPLWQSRKFAGDIPQFNLHAVARIDGNWQAWSYSQGDFYKLPSEVRTEEIALIKDCAPL